MGKLGPWLVAALLVSSCTTTGRPSPTPSPTERPTAIASAAPSPSPSPTATPECAVRALAAMTEEQRIGQLFLLGLANDQLGAAEQSAIRTYHFGSVWFVEQSAAGAPPLPPVAQPAPRP